jgi:exonuclease III
MANVNNNFKIVHWNCNSINNKQDEFKLFIQKHKPEIILLNETKINDFNANIFFNQIFEYQFLHKQRCAKNGAGGVAILIKRGINFSLSSIFDHLNIELLAINVKINNKNIQVVSYYNPPDVKLS